jgi:cell division GTPase FtsZ
MRVAAIGVGLGGSRIVDRLLAAQRDWPSSPVRDAAAVNTAQADLLGLEQVPERNRILVGQSRVKGHGVGADVELGAEIVESEPDAVREGFVEALGHDPDAFLVVAGLGGGTGGGGLPVLAEHLRRVRSEPVFGVALLPGSDEGGIYTLNAARSLDRAVGATDGLVLFDNDAWRQATDGDDYEQLNGEIVRRLLPVLTADEGAEAIGTDDLVGTLSGPLVSLGHSVEAVETGGDGLLSRLTGSSSDPDETNVTTRIAALTRKAALGRLTLPCEVGSADRAALVVDGPETHLSTAGLERGAQWLSGEVGADAASGLTTVAAGRVSATVVLSGVTGAPRLAELEQVAIEAAEDIDDARWEHAPSPGGETAAEADDGSGDTRVFDASEDGGSGDTRVYDGDDDDDGDTRVFDGQE